jgi:hypothetical protein
MRSEDSLLVRPVALAALGQRYRCYRLADPPAEEAMAASLRRWGQLAPVVACRRGEELELLDGFKRWTAAQQVAGLTTLSVRVLEMDEQTAKAAILGLNRGQRGVRELEEAWIVQALVRDDGLRPLASRGVAQSRTRQPTATSKRDRSRGKNGVKEKPTAIGARGTECGGRFSILAAPGTGWAIDVGSAPVAAEPWAMPCCQQPNQSGTVSRFLFSTCPAGCTLPTPEDRAGGANYCTNFCGKSPRNFA